MESKKAWFKILEKIKEELDSANFRTWFSTTNLLKIEGDKITLSVPSAFIKEQLKLRYASLMEKVIDQVLGKRMVIEFVVDSSKVVKKSAGENEEDLFITRPASIYQAINPKYTLENFVVGLSNNVAFAAAQAVVQNPGISYNPLFIYGGTGVGKTHLMLAIGNALLSKNPNLKIIYCASEKFMNDYVEAIQNHKMGDLRNKYRSLDVLLIDDIQFFSGREGTQEEFFHTFNELQSKNSQMVLTSDRPPGEIGKLEDRLKSRLAGGLMIDIQTPDFDTRVAIIRAKCLEHHVSITEETLQLLASSIDTNIRELEGKLVQILQTLKTQNLSVTIENISSYLNTAPKSRIVNDYRQVLNLICTYFNLTQKELTGPNRQKGLVLPRHITMFILSEQLSMTVEKIGQVLGGRDHTTVMHGRDRIKKLVTTDREVQRILGDLKQQFSTSN